MLRPPAGSSRARAARQLCRPAAVTALGAMRPPRAAWHLGQRSSPARPRAPAPAQLLQLWPWCRPSPPPAASRTAEASSCRGLRSCRSCRRAAQQRCWARRRSTSPPAKPSTACRTSTQTCGQPRCPSAGPARRPTTTSFLRGGESLRQGSDEAWRPFLATTNQLANLQVSQPGNETAVRADDALVAWAAKQHTYTADLLAPPAAAAVQALLLGQPQGAQAGPGGVPALGPGRGLSLAERKEVVQVLRQLAAVAQPNRHKSQSHVAHCPQASVEQAATTALLKAQTRIRTMGFPRKVAVKGFTRQTNHRDGAGSGSTSSSTSTAAPGSLGLSASRPKQPGACVHASEMVDTQMSRVPLKWAGSSLVPPSSSYTAAFGAHPGRSPQMDSTVFREVNVGMGHVDQHLYPTSSSVYPVEALYLSLPAKHQPQPLDAKTTHRRSFPWPAAAATATGDASLAQP